MPLIEKYHHMVRLKKEILEDVPKFNHSLVELSRRKKIDPEDSDYLMALQERKKLMDQFTELDHLGKKIRMYESKSTTEQRLHDNVYVSIIQFLQEHMFTLQLLPSVGSSVEEHTLDPSVPKEDQIAFETLQKEIFVLQEQSKQVESFLAEATNRRRFEDVQMLKQSLEELIMEIAIKRKQLESYDPSIMKY